MKLIDLHKKWVKNQKLPKKGLCRSLRKTKYYHMINLFTPSSFQDMDVEESFIFWASGLPLTVNNLTKIQTAYTPRRQSIVLLMCAMRGEL